MENGTRRPALVLSPAAYAAATGLLVVCPAVSEARGYPFEVPLPSRHLVGWVILADRITSIAVSSCDAALECHVSTSIVRSVQERLLPLLVSDPQRILTASEGAALPREVEAR
jgi:mRNA interferase MazF